MVLINPQIIFNALISLKEVRAVNKLNLGSIKRIAKENNMVTENQTGQDARMLSIALCGLHLYLPSAFTITCEQFCCTRRKRACLDNHDPHN
jgi:hypothetical protein